MFQPLKIAVCQATWLSRELSASSTRSQFPIRIRSEHKNPNFLFFLVIVCTKNHCFLLRTFHNYRLARLKQGTAASALLCTSENKAGRDPALFCVCTHFTVNYMQTQLIASKYPIYCITFRHGNRKSVRFTKIVLITK